ncbi:MAG: 23S rRNA (pseudouridine(1915)-N(3))-methyltransferase RlmH [Myxococcaceae bacterium]
MKVRLASIGKDRSGLFAPGVAEYQKRLTHYARFELLELPEARGRSGAAAKDDEGERLQKLQGPRDWLVALDERGEALSSVELAKFIGKAQTASHDLLFVIGGDEGLQPSLVSRAKRVLSLSKMTLPHRLARLVLIEQLYRAFTVLRWEPYHK